MKTSMFLAGALATTVQAIDNGYGLTPPMGWRSWNCYHANVNQTLMENTMDKVAERTRMVNGKLTSMADLGYVAVGLDDNWQACGTGVNGSFHDAAGHPLINTKTFPSMKGMTDYGHAKGLRVGWYMNNCICAEKHFTDPTYIQKHMEESVKAIVAAGFDGVKLDGCGQFRNLTWWGQLLNETGRSVMIENCHWGGTVPGQTTGDAPCTGTTMPSNCPYNFFRSSTDINPSWKSIFSNLQTTIKFQGNPPLSRPGTWAYPDMLEVGNMATYNEDRTHFGAWCIVSSPLILGHDLTNEALTDKIWPIISNTEAIAVNQAWAGHPGRLVKQWGGVGGNDMQMWAKALPEGKQAVLILSNNDGNMTASIDLEKDIGMSGTVSVRDIWNHKDLGKATGTFSAGTIETHDSRFYIFSQ
eukprot:TRINITY_DN129_c0_g1_i1.p1 TRINITY_DN129_c0_g1~~TRINITY_DN129_c0_g1_i1.p1  ORF type:complete len:413 (+),score=99.17 TRINITY_DN129_c0_g1_i1:62-1300(+)